jgi:hypothetical protein
VVGQREVAEVVDGELGLPAAGPDPGQLVGHHGRVVDEHVEAAARGQEAVGEAPHAAQVGQVEGGDLHPRHVADLLFGLPGPPGGHDHGRARGAEPAGDRGADARVAAGHDGQLAGEIEAGQDVGDRAVGGEAAVDRVLWGPHVLRP